MLQMKLEEKILIKEIFMVYKKRENKMKNKYEKISYNNTYNKDNYSQYKCYLKPDLFKEINKFLEREKISKSDFIKIAYENFESGDLKMKKYLVYGTCDYFKKDSNGYEYEREADGFEKHNKKFNNLIDAQDYLKTLKINIEKNSKEAYAYYYVLSDITNVDEDDVYNSDHNIETSTTYCNYSLKELVNEINKLDINNIEMKPEEINSFLD